MATIQCAISQYLLGMYSRAVDTALYISLDGVGLLLFGWPGITSRSFCCLTRKIMKAKREWLLRTDSNVALKVINMGINAQEFKILQHLQYSSVARDYAEHPGRHSVVQLLDHFDLSTSHKCLVLPVMGMDVQSSIDVAYGGRLNRKTARSVSLQVAMGLDYLWICGIAHGGGYILAYCGWRLLRIVRFALEKCLVYRTRNLSTFRGPDNISLQATSYQCSQETRWSALPAFDAVLSRRANIYERTWCRDQDN